MTIRIHRRSALALPGVLVAASVLTPRIARAADPIRLVVFPSGSNWPIWIAQEKGFFARHGVSVEVTDTPNSTFQMSGLIEGRFDLAVTAMDNVVAYVEGQGEARGVPRSPDLVAFMGGNDGFLRLISVPDIRSLADLRGRELSVDALTTGFAFVLRKLLERGGVREDEVSFVRVGGTQQRFDALMERRQAATLVTAPLDAVATLRGFHVLANPINLLGAYQGSISAGRREWLRSNPARAIAYIRGTLDALDWLYDPGNKAEAVTMLRRNLPALTPELAEASYRVMVRDGTGFARRAELDLPGVRTVLGLRSQYAGTGRELTDAGKYFDLAWYQQATA